MLPRNQTVIMHDASDMRRDLSRFPQPGFLILARLERPIFDALGDG